MVWMHSFLLFVMVKMYPFERIEASTFLFLKKENLHPGFKNSFRNIVENVFV